MLGGRDRRAPWRPLRAHLYLGRLARPNNRFLGPLRRRNEKAFSLFGGLDGVRVARIAASRREAGSARPLHLGRSTWPPHPPRLAFPHRLSRAVGPRFGPAISESPLLTRAEEKAKTRKVDAPCAKRPGSAAPFGLRLATEHTRRRGRSSVVERQLPKLYVVGSIPIARSKIFKKMNRLSVAPPHQQRERNGKFREQNVPLATKSPEEVPSYVPPMFSATRPDRGDAAQIRNSPAGTSACDRDASQLPLANHLLSSANPRTKQSQSLCIE